MNVDPAELEKFNSLAARWWDPAGDFRPLHDINPLRLDWIERHAPLAAKQVVDVGCGGGILTEGMARRGARVTGIDLADKPLRVAELHLRESHLKIDYRNASAESLAEQHAGAFDAVTCMELLEHVPDLLLDDHPRPEGLSLRRHRRGIRPRAAAEGHPRRPAVHKALGAHALVPRGRPANAGARRHDLQPAVAPLQPRERLRRQLPPVLRA